MDEGYSYDAEFKPFIDVNDLSIGCNLNGIKWGIGRNISSRQYIIN